jgi:ferredoxin
MTAVMIDNPRHAEGTSDRRKIVEKFWIDYARCMRCNICIEVCPFEAIVMDNNWSGHEHAAYDRRDLHMDIDDLTQASRAGLLTVPFRPQDRIDAVAAEARGEQVAEVPFKFSLATARAEQEARVARGEGRAIQLRPPEKPKAIAAAAAGSAGGEEAEVLSERKLRARRMKVEREMQEFVDRGEDVPAEVTAAVEKYRSMQPDVPYGGGGSAVAAVAPAAGSAGVQGDPNSPRKLRARRMRAERDAKAALDAGQEIPAEIMAALAETGSDMASEEAKVAVATAATAAAPAAADAEGGDSPRKQRARRMKAERAAREAIASGEPVPGDVVATLASFDITVESLQRGD